MNDKAMVTPGDVEKLQHMLGVQSHIARRSWGSRNFFAPSANDVPSMRRLEAAGLVRQGCPYGEAHYYHATEAGCALVGLDSRQIRRAME